MMLISVAAGPQEQPNQGTGAALALQGWRTAAAPAQSTQLLSLGSRAEGPSEVFRPSDTIAGYRVLMDF